MGLVFTAGAGGRIDAPVLNHLAEGLRELGHPVVRFDLPYMASGKKSPPKAERSAPGYSEAFAEIQRLHPKVTWAAGGKSYGGRVASIAVADGMPAAGLAFFSYPLHAPGKKEQPRCDHWPSIQVPCLFMEGTKDPFCDHKVFESCLPRLGGRHELMTVDGGDHALRVPAKASPDGKARSDVSVISDLLPGVSSWLRGLGPRT